MKRFTVALAIMAICCGRVSAQVLSPDVLAGQYLLEAKKALEDGKPETAIQAFRKIEALDTEPPQDYVFFYGKLLVEHGKSRSEFLKGQSLLEKYVLSSARYAEYYTPTLALLAAVEAKLEGFKGAGQLAAAGADVSAEGNDGYSPLHLAARQGKAQTVATLIAAGAEVNARGKYGITPLHLAVGQGEAQTVATLIAAGADVNARDTEGDRPLYYAVAYGRNLDSRAEIVNSRAEIVKALLAAGADPNTANSHDGEPVLRIAIRRGSSAEIVKALIAAGADILNYPETRGREYGYLQLAGGSRNLEIVQALLAEGGFVNQDLRAAMHEAVQDGSAEIVEALLTEGVDANDAMYADVKFKWLHMAASRGKTETVKVLIAAGADVNAKDQRGRRPLRLAESRGHVEVAEVLRAAGAER